MRRIVRNDRSDDGKICEICGKTETLWVKYFSHIFLNGKKTKKEITFCQDCGEQFGNLLEIAETRMVTDYLLLQAPHLLC